MRLVALAILAASCAALSFAAKPAPEMGVAVASYTFHTFTVFEAIERTAQTGAHCLETFTNQALRPGDSTKSNLGNNEVRRTE